MASQHGRSLTIVRVVYVNLLVITSYRYYKAAQADSSFFLDKLRRSLPIRNSREHGLKTTSEGRENRGLTFDESICMFLDVGLLYYCRVGKAGCVDLKAQVVITFALFASFLYVDCLFSFLYLFSSSSSSLG